MGNSFLLHMYIGFFFLKETLTEVAGAKMDFIIFIEVENVPSS